MCLFSCVAPQPHQRTVAEPESSPTAKLREREACWKPLSVERSKCNTPTRRPPLVWLKKNNHRLALLCPWTNAIMNQKQGKTLKTKVVSGGVTSSPRWLYNMGLLEGVQKREFWQQLRHPHLTHTWSPGISFVSHSNTINQWILLLLTFTRRVSLCLMIWCCRFFYCNPESKFWEADINAPISQVKCVFWSPGHTVYKKRQTHTHTLILDLNTNNTKPFLLLHLRVWRVTALGLMHISYLQSYTFCPMNNADTV